MPANTEFLKAAASMIKKQLPRAPRSPKAKLTITAISAEECDRLFAIYDSRPKHPRSELSRSLESLEVGGTGINLAGSSLASIKSSCSKFAKTTGKAFRVARGDKDGEVIVRRTE
jgi:hypothetical protein